MEGEDRKEEEGDVHDKTSTKMIVLTSENDWQGNDDIFVWEKNYINNV